MKLELSLLDLNELYYMSSKTLETRKEYLKDIHPTSSTYTYFHNEVLNAERLSDMLRTAIDDEIKKLDEFINEVKSYQNV